MNKTLNIVNENLKINKDEKLNIMNFLITLRINGKELGEKPMIYLEKSRELQLYNGYTIKHILEESFFKNL